MKYRTLGSTGLEVSEIGFGTWGIGGVTEGTTSYGPVDDQTARRALEKAFDLGINFFDTANIYGAGRSEYLLGEVFSHRRERVIIATKVGRKNHVDPPDFSPQGIQASLEGSLRRLKTDYVDLLQLHNADVSLILSSPKLSDILSKLKREGKVRFLGISMISPNEVSHLKQLRDLGYETIQINFNLIDQRAIDNGVLELANHLEMGIIIRTPLCFGFLSGSYVGYRSYPFDKSDHRRRWSVEQIKRWSEAPRLFEKMINEQCNYVQLALKYCLHGKEVSTIIPGMVSEAQVNENAMASAIPPLSAENYKQIRKIYKRNVFFIDQKRPL